MGYTSIPTRGRTLDYAAGVYDILEPWVMFGKQSKINRQVVEFLDIKAWNKILDIGCGTGVVTKLISEQVSSKEDGIAIGIDAAGKMIEGAVKKSICRISDARFLFSFTGRITRRLDALLELCK
ncbi:MAG: class I SAM-dependent methyltransferase [Desulfobacula sp.]|jgi:ubiquinone/menaquinone biosynthesis C-methylase UbiE|uniref:class I SAM-dependent methyltransferase n=1 Tax=Desulfobacula sp. TaxID=2593537 RepID=UPI001DE35037|nr:class I SAM-dependent methyltransferase [Desulfobacula sp.]MBT3484547.1 class I SAM-dependent methyltransferase [Desulfobacula sp.]MBT3803917.1 class I SAM-dependent methyltransferase [Desulfobacula sp.]MBT4023532.1 class I SAM-dependent methyltransferase [Desulfobacula sp.]MBT4197800.1 class I SAM-dependent methyltransferase [Desulfobacula sp.]